MCDVPPHVQCPARAIHAQVRVYVYVNTNNPVQSGPLIVRGTSGYDARFSTFFAIASNDRVDFTPTREKLVLSISREKKSRSRRS